MIICNCDHDFQDQQYGFRKRVANTNIKGGCRCTVCDKEHQNKTAVKTATVKK